jgi:hypothetical protein
MPEGKSVSYAAWLRRERLAMVAESFIQQGLDVLPDAINPHADAAAGTVDDAVLRGGTGGHPAGASDAAGK